ncbi:MAG: dipeptide ABC transporter ATP-binding protein [Janthinobacterium lividum]
MIDDVLRLEGLSVALPRGRRVVSVLDALDLAVPAGEMVALVGESGSGKTMAALAAMRLLPPGAVLGGQALLRGQDGETRDLLRLGEAALRRVRGRDIGMVFQNPLAALNPSHTVGQQVAEAVRAHTDVDRRGAMARARALLDEVGIPDAANRLGDHPHQFSGGMRQRVMIASALACSPRLLIADEPTTGLDPLVARQIMALLARLRRERGMGVLFVTHDLSVVEEHASRVHVLYAGRSVEWGAAGAFFAHPSHPYSQALLGSVARVGRARLRTIPGTLPEPEARPPGCRFAPRCAYYRPPCDDGYPEARAVAGTMACCLYPPEVPAADFEAALPEPPATARRALLDVEDVSVRYGRRGLFGKAPAASLAGAAFRLGVGECLGVVGESGSGKSTLGRAILQMAAYEGRILLDGHDLGRLSGPERVQQRRRVQVVFQDPRESLNPRMTVGQSVGEPLRLAGRPAAERRAAVAGLLERVGLPAALADRLPGSVSGGQAQRIAIARALAAEPDVIVLDEPTSALDVSTQAMLLNLLKDLSTERGLAYVFISHDLAAVSYLAHRIAVLRAGRIVELADTASLLARPGSDYTRALLEAAPQLGG